ncbi:MAG: dihydrolipoyl dehydrogenase [Clostridiales bacterium]|nr:dihydrolipoyl dehydrogenase [Clostridiales bacterium]
MDYELIVLGGGPGGYTGAIRAAKLGKRVALIEKDSLGGTCLNRGCIPTKALLHSAELYSSKSEWAELGILAENVTLDEGKIYERKQKVVATLRDGVKSLVKANGIDLIEGEGVLTGEHTIKVGDREISADYILLATGSVPSAGSKERPLIGVEYTVNSDDVLAAPVKGDNITIIGAGVIALEFATYYAAIGKSVTLLAPGERIIKMMSKDASVQLTAVLKKQGVKIVTGVKVKSVDENHTVYYATEKGEASVTGDAVITAIGRKPVLDIGLNKVGITVDKFIAVDDNMYTGKAGIYACGDITGKMQLAHFAAASAITAVESMFGLPHSMDLSVCPSCIYTSPELASVGKKETDIENAKVGKFLMGANGKSLIEGVNRGYIKVIADENDVVVGAEIFSVRGTDIMGELSLAIAKGLKTHEVSEVIHPHPTVMEAIGESVEDIYGLATHMAPRRR